MSWWLFADSLPAEGSLFEFCELQPYRKGQVMIFLGKIGERVGDWKIFPSKIKNMKELILDIGNNDIAWKTKRFVLKPTEDKKAVIAMIA